MLTRKTEDVDGFPFLDPRMCWVLVTSESEVLNPHGETQRLDAVTLAMQGGGKIFIAWPGRVRTDLFEVGPGDLQMLQESLSNATRMGM